MAATLLALRTAAQKYLTGRMSGAGATYVRYLFAFPLALIWMAGVHAAGAPLPTPSAGALFWCVLVALGQMGGTRFLLRALEERNFATGVAYSKTDVVQAAVIEALVLAAAFSAGAAAGMIIATAGVMLMSLSAARHPLVALGEGLASRSALFGLASGACFALAGVSVRGAVTSMDGGSVTGAAAVALTIVLAFQTFSMGAFLVWREPLVFARIAASWRIGLFTGVCGAGASICWFIALGLQSAALVRTLGLAEVVVTVLISRYLFREAPRMRELAGIAVLLAGIIALLNSG